MHEHVIATSFFLLHPHDVAFNVFPVKHHFWMIFWGKLDDCLFFFFFVQIRSESKASISTNTSLHFLCLRVQTSNSSRVSFIRSGTPLVFVSSLRRTLKTKSLIFKWSELDDRWAESHENTIFIQDHLVLLSKSRDSFVSWIQLSVN